MYFCVEYVTLYKSNCIFSPVARSTWARPFTIMWYFYPHVSHKAAYMELFDKIHQNEIAVFNNYLYESHFGRL